MSPMIVAVLSGPDLDRTVDGIPRNESCRRTALRAHRGWVVVSDWEADELFGPSTVAGCVRTWRPRFVVPSFRIYGPGSPPRT